jgi:hypothetical protein
VSSLEHCWGFVNSDGDSRIIAFSTSVADFILKAIHSIKPGKDYVRRCRFVRTHSSIPWLSGRFRPRGYTSPLSLAKSIFTGCPSSVVAVSFALWARS